MKSFLKSICSFLCILLGSYAIIFAQYQDIGNGVNIQASYYNNGIVTIGWDLMKTYPEIEAVRIEIEPDRANQAIRWIREAQENGYQVIATYHRAARLGSNNKEDLLTAANWWVQHYNRFTALGPITINLMNEWGNHDISPEEYADAYNEAIDIVRDVYDGTIIVDLPGFGHNINIGVAAYPLLEDEQIIYSLHIYPNSVNTDDNNWVWVDDLDKLENEAIPWIIGEFGTRGTGGTNWCSIVEYAYQNERAIFGWAWNGDGGVLNMVSPSWLAQPRATVFQPTSYLEQIVAALDGVPCFTQDFENNSTTPCIVGESCNDNNDFTINDRFNEFCVCTGNFTSGLRPSTDEQLFLFPNPVSQNLSIEFFKLNRPTRLEIYSTTGQQVFDTPLSTQTELFQVNVQSYPNGTYLVVVHQNGRASISRKFIKFSP